MKNRLFLFCLLAALAVSCVKEQQEVTQTVTDDPVFYAAIEEPGNPVTRVFADSQLRVLWNAEDRVSIFNKSTYNWQYRFDGEDGDNAGVFKKVPSDDFVPSNPLDYVYAIYPYNENTKISNDGEMTVYLPAEQSYRKHSFGLGANTMISVTEDNELHFMNLCGYFAVKLYGDNVSVKSISIKGNNNELLAGKATVVAQMNTVPTFTFNTAEATKEISLTFDSPVSLGTTAETATSFWFVVPPTIFVNGFTLTMTDKQNGIFEKKTSGTLEIKRNTLKNTTALKVVPELPSGNIVFADEKVKAKLVAAFDTNGDGEISFVEAAAVTSNADLKNAFGAINTYKSFDEFQYFTGITTIPESMFKNWNLLTSVSIHNGVTSIGKSAFSGCASLTEIIIPEKVTCIDDFVFSGCSELDSIVLPAGLLSIGYGAFADCSDLTSIILPDSVIEINKMAFSHCHSLKELTLPTSVKTIESEAFAGCKALAQITIPEGVKKISEYLFYDCQSLTKVYLPKSTQIIREEAFCKCSSLAELYCQAQTPPQCDIWAFEFVPAFTIYVPWQSVDNYKNADGWSEYADRIQPILPEAVDLGLSVKWASFNLGATAPEEYGDYYAWGDTEPYYSSQDPLTWEAGKEYGYEWISYKWCKGSYNTLSKYCSMSSYGYNGFTDNKTVLDLEDDAAHVNLGGTWRMPTDAEFTELLNNCILEWALINGISGRKVTGPNGNSIFLPAPGLREGGSYINVGSCGYYWSSSLHADYPNSARLTSFDRGYLNREYYPRFYGLSVRPVCPKE